MERSGFWFAFDGGVIMTPPSYLIGCRLAWQARWARSWVVTHGHGGGSAQRFGALVICLRDLCGVEQLRWA